MTRPLRSIALSLLAACGASPSPAPAPSPPRAFAPAVTPVTENYPRAEQPRQPEQRVLAYQEQVIRLNDSAAGAASDGRCEEPGALCSLSGCGDGKTLCEYVTTPVKPFVRRVIRHHEALFMRCYQAYRNVDPSAEGTVQARFTVDASGAVMTATATGIHASVEACVTSALQTLTFPELRGHTTNVVYPFVFVRQP